MRAVEVGSDLRVCNPGPGHPYQSSLIVSSAPWRPTGGAAIPTPAGAKGLLDFLSTLDVEMIGQGLEALDEKTQ